MCMFLFIFSLGNFLKKKCAQEKTKGYSMYFNIKKVKFIQLRYFSCCNKKVYWFLIHSLYTVTVHTNAVGCRLVVKTLGSSSGCLAQQFGCCSGSLVSYQSAQVYNVVSLLFSACCLPEEVMGSCHLQWETLTVL